MSPATLELTEERAQEARRRLEPIRGEYPFTPRFIAQPAERGGVVQHYLDEGPNEGEPLLFVHGNPTWSFAWRHAVRTLSTRYRCIAPDHLGCGLSDKPQEYAYRLTRHVENLERLVLHLDLERVTLVLHDWGGPIGLGFARRHPERIRRIVVSNTAGFRSTRMPWRIAACRIPVFGKLAVRGLNAFARSATFMAVEKPLPSEVKRGYLLPYDSWNNRIATLTFVEDIPMHAGHPSYAELTAIEASLESWSGHPFAILWGERDWCFDPSFRVEWERRLPHAETTRFENAGHYLFEDAADHYVGALASFLGRNPIG